MLAALPSSAIMNAIAENSNERKSLARKADDDSQHVYLCALLKAKPVIEEAAVLNLGDRYATAVIGAFASDERIVFEEAELNDWRFLPEQNEMILYWPKEIGKVTPVRKLASAKSEQPSKSPRKRRQPRRNGDGEGDEDDEEQHPHAAVLQSVPASPSSKHEHDVTADVTPLSVSQSAPPTPSAAKKSLSKAEKEEIHKNSITQVLRPLSTLKLLVTTDTTKMRVHLKYRLLHPHEAEKLGYPSLMQSLAEDEKSAFRSDV
jgi:hypothetical protein